MNFEYYKRVIFSTHAGSHLYGTSTPESDQDFRGVIIPPVSYFFGLDKFEQCEDAESLGFAAGTDVCYFDIRKFVQLAAKGNPNILHLLWTNEPQTSFGQVLQDMRQHFITKAIIKPHIGMAIAHMAKLEHPGRKCGTKGKVLIEKFGYNTKDAAVVLMTLDCCIELLTNQRITFPRPDAKFLLAVRNGQYALGDVLATARNLLNVIKRLEDTLSLPKTPNRDLINRELEFLVRYYLQWKGEL